MATLVFTALGTAVGGPLGGAIGSLIGHQLDRAIIGGGKREGPRLKELAVTTSSYGTPLPRHFGTVRVAGTIIWATDLVESRDKSGGGKGKPSTTTYSYSASFAVALASRPIARLGRVWADGTLLRGEAGDLKVGGELRVYTGHGDQRPDPLIAADKGATCPAFSGLAYCVFEGLHLADFGNRIPAVTFEVIADDGEVSLADLLTPLVPEVETGGALAGLLGFSDEGGSLVTSLEAIDTVYPLRCDAGGERLSIALAQGAPATPPYLPPAAIDPADDSFGGVAGQLRRRQGDAREVPDGLRYYDVGRDFQAGLQRADGRARPGRSRVIEFAGVLAAETARGLINGAAERADRSNDSLAYRIAELDPALAPGAVVRVPGRAGQWRIDSWEWRETGVELDLRRLPIGPPRATTADPGEALAPPDQLATATQLAAFELPFDGMGTADTRRVYAAVSSASGGWTGAALYADHGGVLVPLEASGPLRSVIGETLTAIPPSRAVRFEPAATLDVAVVSDDFRLDDASPEALANGVNRALVGGEVLQFADAAALGDGVWRLRGLLRGRGGLEHLAGAAHAAGSQFVLLDGSARLLDPAELGAATTLAAIGLADTTPVTAAIVNPGVALRPLTPVHPRVVLAADGGLSLAWTRRSRGAWTWLDGVDAPLGEQIEAYVVGVGDTDAPALRWELGEPRLTLSAATRASLAADHAGQPLWVRQVGSFATSQPLLLTLIA